MDPFQQADSVVQVCSGIFGIIAIPLLIYFFIIKKKKPKP